MKWPLGKYVLQAMINKKLRYCKAAVVSQCLNIRQLKPKPQTTPKNSKGSKIRKKKRYFKFGNVQSETLDKVGGVVNENLWFKKNPRKLTGGKLLLVYVPVRPVCIPPQ